MSCYALVTAKEMEMIVSPSLQVCGEGGVDGKAVGKKQTSTVSVISYKLHPFLVHPPVAEN